MKKTLLILTIFLLQNVGLFAQADTKILVDADQMPYFSGCPDYEDGSIEKRQCSERRLIQFISEHLVYPEAAKNEQVEGMVIISFVIDENGMVTDPYVVRDIGGGCAEAAMDVVDNMPVWEPAIHEGSPSPVKLNLPIQFYLKDEIERLSGGYSISWGRLASVEVTKETIQENMDAKVVVRDEFGNSVTVNELIFSFARKKRYYEERSSGNISREMEKISRKIKPGGVFTITAAVQKGGKFVYIDKAFRVVE